MEGSASGPHSTVNGPNSVSLDYSKAPVTGCVKPPSVADHTALSSTEATHASVPVAVDAKYSPPSTLSMEYRTGLGVTVTTLFVPSSAMRAAVRSSDAILPAAKCYGYGSSYSVQQAGTGSVGSAAGCARMHAASSALLW